MSDSQLNAVACLIISGVIVLGSLMSCMFASMYWRMTSEIQAELRRSRDELRAEIGRIRRT